MKHAFLAAMLVTLVFVAPVHAVTCVNGVYRAGCVGPNGAAVVRKPPYPRTYYAPRPPAVSCARGPYRAGCVGPNGAAVVRRPY